MQGRRDRLRFRTSFIAQKKYKCVARMDSEIGCLVAIRVEIAVAHLVVGVWRAPKVEFSLEDTVLAAEIFGFGHIAAFRQTWANGVRFTGRVGWRTRQRLRGSSLCDKQNRAYPQCKCSGENDTAGMHPYPWPGSHKKYGERYRYAGRINGR